MLDPNHRDVASPLSFPLRAIRHVATAFAVLSFGSLAMANGCGSSFSGGSGTLQDPFLLGTAADLTALQSDANCWFAPYAYKLTDDIDMSAEPTWTHGIGTNPSQPFYGWFDGDGYTISGLTIASDTDHLGLFGYGANASVTDVSLVDLDVRSTATSGVGAAGGLFGTLVNGQVTHVHAAGYVAREQGDAGGLIGHALSSTDVADVDVAIDVLGSDSAGGLVAVVGFSPDRTTDGPYVLSGVRARGSVTATTSWGGGLIGVVFDGDNQTSVTDAVAHGAVTGGAAGGGSFGGLVGMADSGSFFGVSAHGNVVATAEYAGGLFGAFFDAEGGDALTPSLSRAYATGSVVGTQYVGGLIGLFGDVHVEEAFATGDVIATHSFAGSFAGEVYGTVPIDNVYALGSTSAPTVAGGLFGDVSNAISVTNAYTRGAVTANSSVGAVVGTNPGNGTLNDTFWNADATDFSDVGSGGSSSATGVSLTDLQTWSTFDDASWPIVDGVGAYQAGTSVWGIAEDRNGGTPFFLWYDPPQDDGGSSPAPPGDSNDDAPTLPVALSSLTIAGVTLQPAFDPNVTTYTVSVPHATTTARVTATAFEGDIVEIGSTTGATRVETDLPLEAGATTTLTVRVRRSGSNDAATYTVTLTRGTASDEAATNVRAIPDAGRAWLTFTPPAVADLLNYEVRIDDGPWTAFFPARSEPPLRLDQLDDGTAYTVRIRGITAQGPTASSEAVSVTPATPDDPPVTLTVDADALSRDVWTIDGSTATRTVIIDVRNEGAGMLDTLWLHLDLPGGTIRDVTPGPGAKGEIVKLGNAWHWRDAGIPEGESSAIALTLESEVR